MMSPTHQHMKLIKSLFLLLFVIAISGCSMGSMGREPSGIIWDYMSSSFSISVVSPTSKGQSLINPTSVEGIKLVKQIKIIYNDSTYICQDQQVRILRAVPEFYKGAFISRNKGRYVISFGEFQPHYSTKQRFQILLPGGETHEVQFVHYALDGKFRTIVWVDGAQQNTANPFEIKISTSNPIWLSSDKDKLRPVTLVVRPYNIPWITNEQGDSFIKDSFYKECTLSYKGKDYPLEAREELDETSERPSFYTLRTLSFGEYQKGSMSNILCFGPFHSDETINKERVSIHYRGKEMPIYFSSYVDSAGKFIYEAWLEQYENQRERLYFFNGPFVSIYFEE